MFTIQGITGSSSDDANNDATLIGSNGQTYTADFNAIAGYTNFNNGDYTVSAGENSVGAVTFQVPVAVTVTKIERSATGDYASFAAGYNGTGRQAVTKISQSGDQVGFTLTSDNPDGTVQTYQGTDTVTGGKIVTAHVVQTG